jgi:hypothetical protein
MPITGAGLSAIGTGAQRFAGMFGDALEKRQRQIKADKLGKYFLEQGTPISKGAALSIGTDLENQLVPQGISDISRREQEGREEERMAADRARQEESRVVEEEKKTMKELTQAKDLVEAKAPALEPYIDAPWFKNQKEYGRFMASYDAFVAHGNEDDFKAARKAIEDFENRTTRESELSQKEKAQKDEKSGKVEKEGKALMNIESALGDLKALHNKIFTGPVAGRVGRANIAGVDRAAFTAKRSYILKEIARAFEGARMSDIDMTFYDKMIPNDFHTSEQFDAIADQLITSVNDRIKTYSATGKDPGPVSSKQDAGNKKSVKPTSSFDSLWDEAQK